MPRMATMFNQHCADSRRIPDRTNIQNLPLTLFVDCKPMDLRGAAVALLQLHCSPNRRSPSDIKLEIEGAGTVYFSRKRTPETPSTPTRACAAMDTSPVNSAPYDCVSPRDDDSKINDQSSIGDISAAYRGKTYYESSNKYRKLETGSYPRRGKSESEMNKSPQRSLLKAIPSGQKISNQGTQTDEGSDYQGTASREIEKTNAHISHLYARVRSLENQINKSHRNTPSSVSDVLDPDVSTEVLKIQQSGNQRNDGYKRPVRVCCRSNSSNTAYSVDIDTRDDEWKPEEEKPSRQSVGVTTPKGVEMVRLGDGFALVSAKVFKKIDWSSYSGATRKLLSEVFTRDVLATHSLTGKPSRAFSGKPDKKQLPPDLVNDIVLTVVERCGVPESMVRATISIKCAEENKAVRMKNKKKFRLNSDA